MGGGGQRALCKVCRNRVSLISRSAPGHPLVSKINQSYICHKRRQYIFSQTDFFPSISIYRERGRDYFGQSISIEYKIKNKSSYVCKISDTSLIQSAPYHSIPIKKHTKQNTKFAIIVTRQFAPNLCTF